MNVSMYSILTTDRRPTSHFENFKGPYLRNGSSDQLHVSSRVGFSGTADLMALFPVRTNPRWRPPPSWKNFKWPYLHNRSSDPLHGWFQGGVFGDGGCNSAISCSNKSKIAAAAILEKFQMAISPQPVVRSTSCFVLRWVFRGRQI